MTWHQKGIIFLAFFPIGALLALCIFSHYCALYFGLGKLEIANEPAHLRLIYNAQRPQWYFQPEIPDRPIPLIRYFVLSAKPMSMGRTEYKIAWLWLLVCSVCAALLFVCVTRRKIPASFEEHVNNLNC